MSQTTYSDFYSQLIPRLVNLFYKDDRIDPYLLKDAVIQFYETKGLQIGDDEELYKRIIREIGRDLLTQYRDQHEQYLQHKQRKQERIQQRIEQESQDSYQRIFNKLRTKKLSEAETRKTEPEWEKFETLKELRILKPEDKRSIFDEFHEIWEAFHKKSTDTQDSNTPQSNQS